MLGSGRSSHRALRAGVAAFVAVLGLTTSQARANGRFPAAGQVVVDPGDKQHIVLRTTYGILQTTDGGKTWHWVCEQAVGYGGIEDPAMGITGDGTLLAGIFEGLSVSHDRGCTWAFEKGALDQQYTIDLAVDQVMPAHALAVTSTGVADGFHVIVAETTDDAKTWKQVGTPLPKDFLALTLELAPSKPDRVYVSGLAGANYTGAIEKTDDRGATWKQVPFDLQGGAGVYIGAIDPTNPDRVYARADLEKDDELYVTNDGASTWTKIFAATGEMLGFALSPDGTKVAAGGPDAGLYLASTTDFAFTQVSQIGVKCLKWYAEGLYACADEFKDGFTLGLSKNDGGTFEILYHLPDLTPLECDPATQTGAACPEAWPPVASTIGAESGDGSVGATGPASATGAATGGAARAPKPSNCSCSIPVSEGGLPEALLAASLASVVALRRRGRRRVGAASGPKPQSRNATSSSAPS